MLDSPVTLKRPPDRLSEGTESLSSLLLAILCPSRDRHSIADLVSFFHKIAFAYLRYKSANRRIDLSAFGMTLNDMAFDAIADLFQCDADGSYVVLKSFAARIGFGPWMPEEQLFAETRRMIFGAVSQRVFRLHGETDPPLAKIIRNIKLALKKHQTVQLGEHRGEKVIVPKGIADLHAELPPIPPELLGPELFDRVAAGARMHEVLKGLGEVMREQNSYRRMTRIVEVACIIRNAHADGFRSEMESGPHSTFRDEEIIRFIDSVVRELSVRKGNSYVDKSKLTRGELNAHMAAVRMILCEEFLSSDGEDLSYFQILAGQMKDLTESMYSEKHRAILEYFAKLARAELKRRLLQEL